MKVINRNMDPITNMRLLSRKSCVLLFCNIYWRVLVIICTPLLLIPIAYIGENNAYKSFYLFMVTATFWITDVLPACVTAIVPIALMTIFGFTDADIVTKVYVRNVLLDCFGVMILAVAIKKSGLNRRIALKLLLIFGCYHYRLSFLLFFSTMFMSMWMSSTVACGIIIPIVEAILVELEKMGIIEIYLTISKINPLSSRHELNAPRPSDFTVFYFLGIAYSSSIGGMATIAGSRTNQIFKLWCETIFPFGPKIEFPHLMLLTLPGVLLMESLLYIWMNFYFLGMFRAQSAIALQIGITEAESLYVTTLLVVQYQQLGKITVHETIVGSLALFTILLQVSVGACYEAKGLFFDSHLSIVVPTLVSVMMLFVAPTNLKFLNFFRSNYGTEDNPLPRAPGLACLNWKDVNDGVQWSVLLIIAGSTAILESFKDSKMSEQFELFLLQFADWPAPALVLVVMLFCKVLTQFAPNSCVVYCLLPNIARLSIRSRVHPHYLMMAATLASSFPFHLAAGTPSNAMVAAYFHIPPWKMMAAGVGPSGIAIVITWFTVTVWSKAIWPNINQYPEWAGNSIFKGST